MNNLVRLVYASHFKPEIDPSELARIHEAALEHNGKQEITGLLLFGNDQFLQCLEGGREAVNALYSKINKDHRHSQATLLSYEQIAERDFEAWSMKLVLMSEAKKQLVLRFTPTGEFAPLQMSPESALKLMLAVRDQSQ